MARVPKRDIVLHRRDGYSHVFEFYENTGTAEHPVQGDALDLSDRTFAMHWRVRPNSRQFVAFLIDDSSSATGVVVTWLEPDTADDLEGEMALKGWYDLESTFVSDGWRETLAQGEVEMDPDVTRVEGS